MRAFLALSLFLVVASTAVAQKSPKNLSEQFLKELPKGPEKALASLYYYNPDFSDLNDVRSSGMIVDEEEDYKDSPMLDLWVEVIPDEKMELAEPELKPQLHLQAHLSETLHRFRRRPKHCVTIGPLAIALPRTTLSADETQPEWLKLHLELGEGRDDLIYSYKSSDEEDVPADQSNRTFMRNMNLSVHTL